MATVLVQYSRFCLGFRVVCTETPVFSDNGYSQYRTIHPSQSCDCRMFERQVSTPLPVDTATSEEFQMIKSII